MGGLIKTTLMVVRPGCRSPRRVRSEFHQVSHSELDLRHTRCPPNARFDEPIVLTRFSKVETEKAATGRGTEFRVKSVH